MKEKKTMTLTFIFSLFIASLSLLFIIFNINKIFLDIIYQIILIISLLSFFMGFIFLRRLINEIKYDVEDKKGREKDVKDCYHYFQFLNPPFIDN